MVRVIVELIIVFLHISRRFQHAAAKNFYGALKYSNGVSQFVRDIRKEILENEIKSSPVKKVLIETVKDGYAYGHTAEFIEVALPAVPDICHKTVTVRLKKTDGHICFSELIC